MCPFTLKLQLFKKKKSSKFNEGICSIKLKVFSKFGDNLLFKMLVTEEKLSANWKFKTITPKYSPLKNEGT